MAWQFSTSARNGMMDAVETATGTTAKLQLWTGSIPANCGTASSGTKLAEITMASDWWANASAGAKTLNSLPLSTTALAAGTIGYLRIVDNAGTTCHLQGALTTDFTVDNSTVVVGQTINVTGFTLTAPGA